MRRAAASPVPAAAGAARPVAARLRPSVPSERRAQDLIAPDDLFNRSLVSSVRPRSWTNPTPASRYNLVVIGGGTGGLVSAVGAAGLGARVALVEKHLMGGDCLNFGCVPSKGIIRSARAAADAHAAGDYGVHVDEPRVDFAHVMARMRRLRADIGKHDSVQRLTTLGIDVFIGQGRFSAPDVVQVGTAQLRFKRAIIATGARAAMPAIPGLAEAGFLTNETVFSLTVLPRRIVVIGAGPIGCELAQAFRRFGSEVTVVSLDPRLLPRDDEDAAAILEWRFSSEGIGLALGSQVQRVTRVATGKTVAFDRGRGLEQVTADEILLAVGRSPNVEGLGLEAAGVDFDASGVQVDDRLRTTNKKVYATGDVCLRYKFTHAADAGARIAIQNALFLGRRKASALHIPWCTFTDPEVAHVGIDAHEAAQRGAEVRSYTVDLAEIDRAVLDGESDGFARVHTEARNGRILGATIVARHAGDLLGQIVLAMNRGIRLGALSGAIAPYPTQGEVWKRLGDTYQRSRLTPRVRAILAGYMRWARG